MEYRQILELIDRASDDGNCDPCGVIIELTTIAQVQVKFHDDSDEKDSLYALIIERIQKIAEHA